MTGIERRRARKRAKRRLCFLASCALILCLMFLQAAPTKAEEGGEEAPGLSAPARMIEPAPVVLTAAEPVVTDVPTPDLWVDEDVEAVAKTVYGEARGCSTEEQAAVVWCILNRVDSDAFPDSIMEVVTQPSQFHGYDESNPASESIVELVLDVFERWSCEKQGQDDVGRTLPTNYLFFQGDGKHNHFSTEYHGEDVWDWSLPNPYDD